MYSEKKEAVFSLTSLEGKVSLIGISLACVHFLGKSIQYVLLNMGVCLKNISDC